MLEVLKAVLNGFLLLGSSLWEKETGWTEPRTKKETVVGTMQRQEQAEFR